MGSGRHLGQISAELMITVSAMIALLLAMYIVNDSLRATWDGQKERLEASTAANQVALAINRAVAGGDGTVVTFNNMASASIANITIINQRAVLAETYRGMGSSTPIITNNTNISGLVPMNREIAVRNIGGVITISES
ncbi:MAG: hypothetical protein WC861_06455 [Candidatus Micrarchaeia archaeon]|jgi:hypothetical protein